MIKQVPDSSEALVGPPWFESQVQSQVLLCSMAHPGFLHTSKYFSQCLMLSESKTRDFLFFFLCLFAAGITHL